MSDWGKLGKVGQSKLLSAIPRGGGDKETRFAMKIKKVIWNEGKYCMDVVVRTADLSIVLTSKRWDLYPSMLPQDIQDAIDYDVCDDSWFIIELEENPNSNASPKRTRFKLLDTQEGLAAMPGTPTTTTSVPSKDRPAAVDTTQSPPAAAGEPCPDWTERDKTLEKCAAAGEPCPPTWPDCHHAMSLGHAFCNTCGKPVGERVG